MNRSIAERGGNILALFFTLAVNGMANGIPLGGQTTGEISDKFPSLFTPAGYVFSIWGLIYLGLMVLVVWQALPAQRANQNLAAIHRPFIASCLCNAAWIFAWHYDFLVLSLVIMVALLTSLVLMYRTLNIGLSTAPTSERWIVHLPLSIYIGWICVATIANISAIQIDRGWDNTFLDATTWTVSKLALAGAVASVMLYRRGDVAFMSVVIWASVGIYVKHSDVGAIQGASLTVVLSGLLLIAFHLANQFPSGEKSRAQHR